MLRVKFVIIIALICGKTTGKPPSTWVCSHLPRCFFHLKESGSQQRSHHERWFTNMQLRFRSVKSQVEQLYPTVDVWTSIVEVQQIRVDTPRKQTWQWNITMFNKRYIFKWCVFHCHVSFLRWIYRGIWEGNHFEEPPRQPTSIIPPGLLISPLNWLDGMLQQQKVMQNQQWSHNHSFSWKSNCHYTKCHQNFNSE